MRNHQQDKTDMYINNIDPKSTEVDLENTYRSVHRERQA